MARPIETSLASALRPPPRLLPGLSSRRSRRNHVQCAERDRRHFESDRGHRGKLRRKNILTEEEFAAKKAELLSRL